MGFVFPAVSTGPDEVPPAEGRHRKMTQGLLDLKRLYWNCHTFRTGRRKGRASGIPVRSGQRQRHVALGRLE